MSWLEDYKRERKKDQDVVTKAKRWMERCRDWKEDRKEGKRVRSEFNKHSPMVRRLLRDVGDIHYGRSLFVFPKYRVVSRKLSRTDRYWELRGEYWSGTSGGGMHSDVSYSVHYTGWIVQLVDRSRIEYLSRWEPGSEYYVPFQENRLIDLEGQCELDPGYDFCFWVVAGAFVEHSFQYAALFYYDNVFQHSGLYERIVPQSLGVYPQKPDFHPAIIRTSNTSEVELKKALRRALEVGPMSVTLKGLPDRF